MPLPVAFILPALNEEETIGSTLDALFAAQQAQGLTASATLVVDNGSFDRTAERAREHGGTVVYEPRRGYGRACQAGMAALPRDTQIVVFTDADGSDDPADLARLIAPIERDEADFVLGSRSRGKHELGSMTLQQRFGNWLAALLLRYFFGARYTDLGPFRAIRRGALDQLRMRDRNYGWTIEMQIKAHRNRLRVIEIPVHYRRRSGGYSKVSGSLLGGMRAGFKIIWTILRYRFVP